jgi:DNA-directed RNA polymerase sigma subunit (sigma70/sigma32)
MNDDGGNFTDEELSSLKLSDMTKEVLENLTAREAKILRERFGVDPQESIDLEEVEKQFDITRARIKEIEEKAIQKLKNRKLSTEIKCSFCGKEKSQVKKLIASEISTSYICGECIKIGMELLAE